MLKFISFQNAKSLYAASAASLLLTQAFATAAPLSPSQKKEPVPSELNLDAKAESIFVKNFGPKRTAPVFKGAFSVGMILIQFPDTTMPPANTVRERLFNFGPMTVTDYFKEYSQGLSWPELLIIGEESLPASIYKAPNPIGFYCEYDAWRNPVGYKNRTEGDQRADTLRDAAAKHAFTMYKKPVLSPGAVFPLQPNGRPHLLCYVYATALVPPETFKEFIEPHYKGLKYTGTEQEAWPGYKPAIPWSDPLWPNSIPQVHVEGGGETVCHELGHIIGAPDFYRAPEKHDGIPGTPSLDWAYGPTGSGYSRYIYNAFLTANNYPTYAKSGTYTLFPRRTNPAGDNPIGCFIPSSHPHYLYCLEYVQGEKAPLGNPNSQGLLISVINTTMSSPLLGSPDLCYVYRPGDPWFRSGGDINNALFGKTTGRTSFSMTTEPSSRLPNLIDGGIEISNIIETEESLTFNLTVKPTLFPASEYNNSLVPKINLDEVTEILPTSIKASGTVTFRGEPMKTDYGFCWSTTPHPKVTAGIPNPSTGFLSLYHRDRYSARITGLRPNTKYYIRGYARNAKGISYSQQELAATTLDPRNPPPAVAPLLQDNFSKNWSIEKYYGFTASSSGDFIGSTAPTVLLKLTAYYRRALGKPGSGSAAIDYTRIHTDPSESRPSFRMKEFEEAIHECAKTAEAAGMKAVQFEEGFDKKFAATFGLRQAATSKLKPIETLTAASMEILTQAVRASLIDSKPVVAGMDSVQLSPRGHGLSWAVIDGFNEQGEFHIVYPRDQDRDFNVKSGWHRLDVLLKEVDQTKLFFGLGTGS